MKAAAEYPVSEESEIDRRLEDLIGKMVSRDATSDDLEEYRRLYRRRVLLMQPRPYSKLQKIRRLRYA